MFTCGLFNSRPIASNTDWCNSNSVFIEARYVLTHSNNMEYVGPECETGDCGA